MGRGNPPPIAVPFRDFGNKGGGLPIRVAQSRSSKGDKRRYCCNCNQEECEAFHRGSSSSFCCPHSVESGCRHAIKPEVCETNNWTKVSSILSYPPTANPRVSN